MTEAAPFVHPYIPNSAPNTRQAMLEAVSASSIEELLEAIPEKLRLQRPLNVPEAFRSEFELDRHLQRVLAKNKPATSTVSFLGSGCYPHYVPAICDEINTRGEFLTAYAGESYEDHGKWQALYEYTSLMADLLEMDVVNVPTYDGYQALATSLRMAVRITGRARVIVPETIDRSKLERVEGFLEGVAEVVLVPSDPATGAIDEQRLAALVDETVGAVLIETPNYLGVVEAGAERIARLAHDSGAIVVCATDPLSIGFLPAPASWGADIVCGDIQSLGLGMHFGGANGGFIATHDDERFVYEFPSRLFGIAPTRVDGELGFVDVAYERTSLAMREEGVEWVGTAAALWGITAAVYLGLMGPQGMTEIGETIAANTRLAMTKLAAIKGVTVLHQDSPHWREFAVRFEGRTAADVNKALLERGIFGGASAQDVFGQQADASEAVYCVTETHTADDIDDLTAALKEIMA